MVSAVLLLSLAPQAEAATTHEVPAIQIQKIEVKPSPKLKLENVQAIATSAKDLQPPTQPTIVAATGGKSEWMQAAGISQADWPHVEAVMGQESSWTLSSINSIGCIGLGQACPGGNKAEMLARCPDWQTNGACQMKVWNDYAIRRYGSWSYAHEWKFCKYVCYNAHTGATVNKRGEPWW